jgi:hypothetical protein
MGKLHGNRQVTRKLHRCDYPPLYPQAGEMRPGMKSPAQKV